MKKNKMTATNNPGEKVGATSANKSSGSNPSSMPPPSAPPSASSMQASTPQRKNSAPGPPRQGTPHLSRSQDNLASQLRKRAVAEKQQQNTGKERNVSGSSVGRSKSSHAGPTRKAPSVNGSSMPGCDEPQAPIKRTQSAQNIANTGSKNSAQSTRDAVQVKKSHSTQNISGTGASGNTGHKSSGNNCSRATGTASSSVMAYNVELLASFEKEKKSLERRISELIALTESRKTDIEKYRFEVKNLKETIASNVKCTNTVSVLKSENQILKDRLLELGVSSEQIIDVEKQATNLRHAPDDSSELSVSEPCLTEPSVTSSPPLSRVCSTRAHSSGELAEIDHLIQNSGSCDRLIAGPGSCDGVGTGLCVSDLEHDLGVRDQWDRQSNKSSDAMSEVSVACLQDRIYQMEESHYSTNEELQATLQELADLQDTVNHLTSENECLADERSVLLESLCAQTEKLENCRLQIEQLKHLIVSESEGKDRSENERQLVALVKRAQEEQDELLLRQVELQNSLTATESESRELQDITTALRDHSQALESKNAALFNEKTAIEQVNNDLRESSAKDQIELQRIRNLLENERSKLQQLEQCRNATQKSDLEELLDTARHEKEILERKLTDAQENVALIENNLAKQIEQNENVEQQLVDSKNNAKTTVEQIRYELSQAEKEKHRLLDEATGLRDHIDTLQIDCDRYLQERLSHDTVVNNLQTQLSQGKHRLNELESEVNDTKSKISEEKQEWLQFQQDLQTAVVIANEMKSETQDSMEQIKDENIQLKEKNQALQENYERVSSELQSVRSEQKSAGLARSEIRGRVLNTVDRELAALRAGRKSVDSSTLNNGQNVKNLIATIEHQVLKSPPLSPPSASEDGSRRNSIDLKSPDTCKDVHLHLRSALRRSAPTPGTPEQFTPVTKRHSLTPSTLDLQTPVEFDTSGRSSGTCDSGDGTGPGSVPGGTPQKTLQSILCYKNSRKSNNGENDNIKGDKVSGGSHNIHPLKVDPLTHLAKLMGGSKRNALLKWCQTKTQNYPGIDITNFSSSWNDGLGFCALMHSYMPDKIPYKQLNCQDRRRNFTLAFKAADSVGIPSHLQINDMVAIERPDWQAVMTYVTNIYKHYEIDCKL